MIKRKLKTETLAVHIPAPLDEKFKNEIAELIYRQKETIELSL